MGVCITSCVYSFISWLSWVVVKADAECSSAPGDGVSSTCGISHWLRDDSSRGTGGPDRVRNTPLLLQSSA